MAVGDRIQNANCFPEWFDNSSGRILILVTVLGNAVTITNMLLNAQTLHLEPQFPSHIEVSV